MARPKSGDKRKAILMAATRTIVAQGLSAPTAGIAREAGVANGSLFTYFETKAELLNALYLDLKTEMALAATSGLREDDELREQLFRVWRNWMSWALASPDKRRALAQLEVSGEITETTREAPHNSMKEVAILLRRVRALGAMRETPMHFVVMLMNAVAEATMDAMAENPEKAKSRRRAGFEALWRMLS